MTENNEIKRVFLGVLADIAERERKRAVQNDKYDNAILASIFEGIFREAQSSYK